MTDRADPVRIKAHCYGCGEVELRSEAIILYVHTPVERSEYTFFCPSCKTEVHKAATEYTIALLRSGGVAEVRVCPPAEFLEPKPGPKLDWLDVVRFLRELRDWDGHSC